MNQSSSSVKIALHPGVLNSSNLSPLRCRPKILPLIISLSTLLFISSCGVSGGPSFGGAVTQALRFLTGQGARSLIGQNDFTSNVDGTLVVNAQNIGGFGAATRGDNGVLYFADSLNHRILGFNSVPDGLPGPNADFVIGQSTFTASAPGSSATQFTRPRQALQAGGRFFVVDEQNNRVLIYNTVPNATNSPPTVGGSLAADFSLGQTNLTNAAPNCAQDGLSNPTSVAYAGGKLIVTDQNNHRVLIYNNVPGTNAAGADLVLGQPNFTTCTQGTTASTLRSPSSVWTDGTRLAVADLSNNRVLIWNTFPTTNAQPADLVLGQPNFTTGTDNTGGLSALSLDDPSAVTSNGNQLFVVDSLNNRTLMWNSFPTSSAQASDIVLGQPVFASAGPGLSSSTVNYPWDVSVDDTHLYVSERNNFRVMIYESL